MYVCDAGKLKVRAFKSSPAPHPQLAQLKPNWTLVIDWSAQETPNQEGLNADKDANKCFSKVFTALMRTYGVREQGKKPKAPRQQKRWSLLQRRAAFKLCGLALKPDATVSIIKN